MNNKLREDLMRDDRETLTLDLQEMTCILKRHLLETGPSGTKGTEISEQLRLLRHLAFSLGIDSEKV